MSKTNEEEGRSVAEDIKEALDEGLNTIIVPGGKTVSVQVWEIIDELIAYRYRKSDQPNN